MRPLLLMLALVASSCTFDYGTLKGKAPASDGAADAPLALAADAPQGSGGSDAGIGGTAGSDGAIASGGSVGTGGVIASGGSVGGGGTIATGGSNGTGGTLATDGNGGTPSTGGTPATGGTPSTGGTPATGGTPTTGGTPATGGTPTTGGTPATGGTPTTGGAPNAGGSATTGGAISTGGDTAAGGATGTSEMTLAQACTKNCALASGLDTCSTTTAVCEQSCMTTFHNTLAVNPDLGRMYKEMMICVATNFTSSSDFVCAKPDRALNKWSPGPDSTCEQLICDWNCSDGTLGNFDPWVDIRCACSSL